MDKKIILELIRKDLDELSLLVQALEGKSEKENVLIELATAKANSLIQEIALLDADNTIETLRKRPMQVVEKAALAREETEIASNDTPREIKDVEQSLSSPEIVEEVVQVNPTKSKTEAEPEEAEAQKESTEEVSSQENEVEEAIAEEPVNDAEETASAVSMEEELAEESRDNEAKTPEVKLEAEETIETEFVEEKDQEPESREQANVDVGNESPAEGKKILGEQFRQEPNLNERLALAREQPSKLFAKPIKSIRQAVGINDRFMYIRELFGNDSDRYNKTIDILDNSGNLMEAVEYLERNCQWQKNDISLKFMELVKRRFGK